MNIETTDNSPLLQECIEELISSKIDEGKGRTAGNYRSAWNKLSTFLGPRVTEFTFADLNDRFSSSLSFMVDARGRRETGSLETG